MEVFISRIPYAATEIEIHNYVKGILHSSIFQRLWHRGFPMSFKLRLHADRRRKGNAHGGTASLLVPDQSVGRLLLTLRPPLLRGKSPVWVLSKNAPNPAEIETLSQTPYLPPDQLLEKEQLERILSDIPKLAALQFGWLDRDDIFSIEWERLYTLRNMTAHIEFVSDKREMRVTELLSPDARLRMIISSSGRRGRRPRIVATSFSNIETISRAERGDPKPSIVFTFHAPPNFEEDPSGIWTLLDGQSRTRESCMDDPEHARLSPFTSLAMRVIFESRGGLDEVLQMARAVKLPSPFAFPSSPVRRSHFSQSDLQWVETWVAGLPWQVAYHTTSLLRNLWLSAAELRTFHSRIDQLVEEVQEFRAAEIVRTFGLYLSELPRVSPGPRAAEMIRRQLVDCFIRAKKDAEERSPRRRLSDGTVLCYHVTVTPTSFMLKGPEVEQSNRVLREYIEYQDSFIRVNFTDEQKLQYRWDREVDGESFVRRRVGGILKNPFVIAGRKFEFLAYSNSALKEHAVWFVKPFDHPTQGEVNAESIRKGLGNFDRVIRCPARFGARMSQAFSATDKSITITAEEIHTIPDIRNDGGVNFTDGVGTISRQVANDISAALEKGRQRKRKRNMVFPHSAFQVRLGGIKGMLSVDHRMSTHDATIYVRPSMVKFDALHSLDVEVAGTFERAKPMYLNRPLIMILETLGVPISVFQELQQSVITSVNNAARSLGPAASLLDQYGLGTSFRVSSILQSLQKLGLGQLPEDEFVSRGLTYAVNDVLRSLKHKARIIVPNSYTLVGVADVHRYLNEGEIFACIRSPHQKPLYLEGEILVTRSPAIHPGDVQMVRAIGKPPINSPFAREELPNCVVFATQGRRSLPQSLGGGDLDGDLYNLIAFPSLFPERTATPGAYPETTLKYLPEGQRCTIKDVADFVCDFLNNDHLGMIANQNLIIADQSHNMSEHPDCLLLAQLASQAVDFAKSGVPANISSMPKLHFSSKPDWSAGEILRNSAGEYYRSTHALGVLYRAIELPDTSPARGKRGASEDEDIAAALEELRLGSYLEDAIPQDEITTLLRPELEPYITLTLTADIAENEIIPQFTSFVLELQYICANHSWTRRPLTEEECWAGTIVAKSSQPRQRNDLQARLRQQCKILVDTMREELSDTDRLEDWLLRAWVAWKVSCALGNAFGAKSYGYIALGSIFEALRALKDLDEYLNPYDGE